MTTQIRDKLIYCDSEIYLNEELLEKYFRKFPEKKPDFKGFMTALWRGYYVTFEIKNKELIITEIEWFEPEEKFDPEIFMKTNFPKNKFVWFSGLIRIDDFRGKYDDENDENATYELLQIKNGNLIQHLKFNYQDFQIFKEIIYEDFLNTEDYKEEFNLWKENNPNLEETKINEYILNNIIHNVREI